MNKKNRKNFIPFFTLLIIHSSLLMIAFIKKRDRKRIHILLLAGTGLCFVFEYIVLSLLKAYQYKPKLLKNKDLDNFFGAIFSQAVFLPFTGVFISAFQIGWKGKLLFTLYFAGIEKLFIKLKVHRNNWWKTTYTMIFIPVYFYINDFWYKHLQKGTPIIQFVSLFFSVVVHGLILLFSMSVLRKFRFGMGRWHSWEEHFKIAPIYSFILSLVTTLTIQKDDSRMAMVRSFLFAKMMDILVLKTKVAKNNFKSIIINNSIHILMIKLAVTFKQWIYRDLMISKKGASNH